MLCFIVTRFTLSSVFFHETLPRPAKNAGKKKVLLITVNNRFPESVNDDSFKILDKKSYVFANLCRFFGVFAFPPAFIIPRFDTLKPRFVTAMYRERAERGKRCSRFLVLGGGASGLAAALAGHGRGSGGVTAAGAECNPGKKLLATGNSRYLSGQHRHRARAVFHLGPGRAHLCWLPSTRRPAGWFSRSASTPAPTRPGGCTPTRTRRQTC